MSCNTLNRKDIFKKTEIRLIIRPLQSGYNNQKFQRRKIDVYIVIEMNCEKIIYETPVR